MNKNEKIKVNKQNSREKALKKEKLTNWYMITLTWGIVGIIALLLYKNCYTTMSILPYINIINWSLTAVFALSGVALLVLSKFNVIKNSSRANNYAIFLGVCGLTTLWLALYNKLRIVIENVSRTLLNNPALNVSSYWNIRIPIIAICAYLIISFIVYVIKVTKK